MMRPNQIPMQQQQDGDERRRLPAMTFYDDTAANESISLRLPKNSNSQSFSFKFDTRQAQAHQLHRKSRSPTRAMRRDEAKERPNMLQPLFLSAPHPASVWSRFAGLSCSILLLLFVFRASPVTAYSILAPSRSSSSASATTTMFLDNFQAPVSSLFWKQQQSPLVGSTPTTSTSTTATSSQVDTASLYYKRRRDRGRLGIHVAPTESHGNLAADSLSISEAHPASFKFDEHSLGLLLEDSTITSGSTGSRRSRFSNSTVTLNRERSSSSIHQESSSSRRLQYDEQVQYDRTSRQSRLQRQGSSRWDAYRQDERPFDDQQQKELSPRERIEQWSAKRAQQRSANRNREELTANSNDDDRPSLQANSLAEWSRTVDLEPLLKRRQVIKHEKLHGKTRMEPSERPQGWTSPSQSSSPVDAHSFNATRINDLYFMVRNADKKGDVKLSKRILHQLLALTPDDARLYRRLSRLEADQGHVSHAIKYLEQGLRRQPKNGYLWHGMATLASDTDTRKHYYSKSIACDPSIPHAHHALGVLLHSQGQIAQAMRVLKHGVASVDARVSHRLHHALGDVYRDAKVWDVAATCYQRSIQLSPHESSLGFAYTNLAFVKYEQGNLAECRQWLLKAVSSNGGKNAMAWQALAQLEETEGNIDAARAVCITALATYERHLLSMLTRHHKRPWSKSNNHSESTVLPVEISNDPIRFKNEFLKQVPVYRPGDRFFNVYRTWLRLEACHGSLEAVEELYERSKIAFPNNYQFALDVARCYLHHGSSDRAPRILEEACRIGSRHAEPYRVFGEYEMRQGNYWMARQIFYKGASKVALSSDDGRDPHGLAELFHSWGICEWHLGNMERAETLFDYALRKTKNGQEGFMLRSVILYTMARFEHARGESFLAQHCIGLCLKENFMPGGLSKVWELWAEVAASMDNDGLVRHCSEMAEKARQDENVGQLSHAAGVSRRPQVAQQDMANMLRREPWVDKIYYSPLDSVLFQSPALPDP